MTKEQVYELVSGWVDSGLLLPKSSCRDGGTYYNVWKQVEEKKLFFTFNSRIVAKDKDVRDQFQKLLGAARVMDIQGVTIRHPECVTSYAIDQLVATGDMLKLTKMPSVALYIE